MLNGNETNDDENFEEDSGHSGSGSIEEATDAFKAMLDDEDDADDSEAEDDEDYSGDISPDTESLTRQQGEKKIKEMLDEEEPDVLEPRSYKVKVDGEEIDVDEAELVKGYSRTADYTKKTTALAEDRKAVAAERARLADGLAELENFMAANPNYHQYAQGISAARNAEMQSLQAERVASEKVALIAAIPSWADSDVAAAEAQELLATAESFHFTAQELGQVSDHRIVLLLRAASRALQADRNRPVVKRQIESIRNATPGTNRARQPRSKVAEAQSRLARTGAQRDAAALFALILDND